MIIRNKNRIIQSTLHFSIYIAVLSICYFLIHKYFESKEISEINLSINKRLADYEETFSYLEGVYGSTSRLSSEDLLSNTTLYLEKRKLIHLGQIEIKKILEKNSENHTYSINYLKNNIRRAILSKAFIDPSVISEHLVEIQFPFYSKNAEFLCFSTVVLLRDILCYYDKIDVISINHDKKSELSSYFFHSLGVSIKPQDTHTKLAIYICFLIISLIYFCVYIFSKHRSTSRNLSNYIKENNFIKRNNLELHNANELLKELDYLSVSKNDEQISPTSIIKKFLNIYENDILEKNLVFTFLEDPVSEINFVGNKNNWQMFLGSVLEILIKESPPGSSLSCSLRITKNSDNEIYYLVFSDGFLINSNLEEKLISGSCRYKYLPKYNMESLIRKMNVFVNFSFSETLGNTISIAYYTNKKIKVGEASNVLVFGR